jgi:hypothetical protein
MPVLLTYYEQFLLIYYLYNYVKLQTNGIQSKRVRQ